MRLYSLAVYGLEAVGSPLPGEPLDAGLEILAPEAARYLEANPPRCSSTHSTAVTRCRPVGPTRLPPRDQTRAAHPRPGPRPSSYIETSSTPSHRLARSLRSTPALSQPSPRSETTRYTDSRCTGVGRSPSSAVLRKRGRSPGHSIGVSYYSSRLADVGRTRLVAGDHQISLALFGQQSVAARVASVRAKVDGPIELY